MAARVHYSPTRSASKPNYSQTERNHTQMAHPVPVETFRKTEPREKLNSKNSNTENDRECRNLPIKKPAERQKPFHHRPTNLSSGTQYPSRPTNAAAEPALSSDKAAASTGANTESLGVPKTQPRKTGSPSVGFVDSNLFNLLHDEDKELGVSNEGRLGHSSENSSNGVVPGGAQSEAALPANSFKTNATGWKSPQNTAKLEKNHAKSGPSTILENFLSQFPSYQSFDSAQIDFTPSKPLPLLPQSLQLMASNPEERNVEKLEKALEEAQRDCESLESQLMQIIKKNEKIIFS
jgi:hypothetical protein